MNGGISGFLASVWTRLAQLWCEYVYNKNMRPEWQVHPHKVYGVVTRCVCAILGSAVPVGLALLGSGVLTKLEDGSRIGAAFWVVCGLLVIIWFLGILHAASRELKDVTHYAIVGSAYPANAFMVLLLTRYIT